MIIPNSEIKVPTIEKPLKIDIEGDICMEGEIWKEFNNVLKFFTKKEALKYVRNYFKNR